MKYIVYLTTNTINGHIYVGIHKTEDPKKFDGYLGCGAYANKPSSYNKTKCHLHQAIQKYGPKSFKRITIKEFDNEEDAIALETYIVNENFVKRTDTYNMVCDGNVPPLHNKTVYQFDLEGNLIKEWNSIKEINDIYKCNEARIRMCVSDKRSFNNFYWAFEKSINVKEYRLSSRGYVYQYNKLGELLNTFDNATIASLKLDINRDAIINAVFNRTLCHGYYFLRADEDIKLLLHEKSSKKLANVTPVYRYTLGGNFDKEYKSIKEACKDTPKSSHGNIIRAIKNNGKCGGYKWSYIKSNKLKPFNELDLKPIKIAQYDKGHNLIKIWNSVSECKKEFPSCQKVCRKERKTTKGFIFEYVEDIV